MKKQLTLGVRHAQTAAAVAAFGFIETANAAVWDDTAKAFVDEWMYGDIATYTCIIIICACVLGVLFKKVHWGAIPGGVALVCVYWMIPTLVTWAKALGAGDA